jgi:ketosteroid isomerase-like protein
MSDLAARVERLEAIEGVRELLWRYASTMDRLPPIAELADLFTEDAVLQGADRHEGRQAILAYYEGILSSLTAARHHIVNSTIAVESGARARHRGYFLALLERDGATLLVHGDYDDVVVRGADGRWRFQEKGNLGMSATTLRATVESEA